jgi:hypothetical protein
MRTRRLCISGALRARALPACLVAVVIFTVPLCTRVALAASVHPLFDLNDISRGPFPSDRFTVSDESQITGMRVALPAPDCAARPSDCADVNLLNELDGFNLSPRFSIPFDGSIDISTATSANIFLVSLGSALPGGEAGGHVSGIDQIVWDPSGTTLYVEAGEQLEQHTRYAFIVTKDLLDPSGKAIKPIVAFSNFVDETITTSTGDAVLDAYRATLREALTTLESGGVVDKGRVVVASVFTTLSASAGLEKIRDQIKAGTPAAASFQLDPGGIRTVFPRSTIVGIVGNRQMSANPAAPLSPMALPLGILDAIPGAIGSIALGKYTAPDYRVHPGDYIPQVATLSGSPLVQGSSDITFLLYLPSSLKPAQGYPVVIYGHGGNSNKSSSSFIAAKMAQRGIATLAIDSPGYGFGPLSTLTFSFTDLTQLTIPSGGRGSDQNADGRIEEGEGLNPAPPRDVLGQGRGDGSRQWAADHMQLVRVIEVGLDADGDGSSDLDASRIYFMGSSFGGRQGAILLAVDPSVRAGVLNVPGSGVEDRLTSSRIVPGRALQRRSPSLINSPGVVKVDGVSQFPQTPPFFHENLPLRQGALLSVALENGVTQVIRSPIVNTVTGALDIQQALERAEWAHQAASSLVFSSYLRRHPLDGVPAKPVIVQFPYGDRVVPNPSTTALLLAGDLADRTTFYRPDIAFPSGNPTPNPTNPILYPHSFLQIFLNDAALTSRALQAQEQIASFFTLDGPDHALDPFNGEQIIDPDADGPIFEVPIALPLPTRMNYPGSAALALARDSEEQLETSVRAGEDEQPVLGPLGPNPMNPSTTISIHLLQPATVRLAVYDTQGRLVRNLVAGESLPAGASRVRWDGRTDMGSPAASGVYFIQLEAGDVRAAKRVVVMK